MYREDIGNGKILEYIWPVPRNTIMMRDIRIYIIADFTFSVETKKRIEKLKGVKEVTGNLTVKKNKDADWDILHPQIVEIIKEC